jgi:tRNA1(Val) A37 N6-methylase TrmN6
MVSLFPESKIVDCLLLDPGAGIGSLSCAFLERWASGKFGFESVTVDAFEIDTNLCPELERSLSEFTQCLNVLPRVHSTDFIEAAVDSILGGMFSQILPTYSHAILNPPYKKMRSHSHYRSALRKIGIETVNLYSAFVALALEMLAPRGQLVAIIPRSFCNGLYYKPFRKFILERSAIRHIHLFKARNRAFKDDNVLQENVIILLDRSGQQGDVVVSTSTDGSFDDLCHQTHVFNRIVSPNDLEQCIHVPTSLDLNLIDSSTTIRNSLEDIGIQVSTGPVVDFRLKRHLMAMPDTESVPLLYPGHFTHQKTEWPKSGFRKANAIQWNQETEKWLYPIGFYTVVRRFTTKEEKRRIVASVVNPGNFPGRTMLGFENHLNVFHQHKQGLPEALANGLAAYLNSTALDDYLRRFNGHTQVNATDLRLLKYPRREELIAIGEWAMQQSELTQGMIDRRLESLAL